MLHRTEALILRTYPLGESDRIVVFLSRDRGKKRGVAKNARQSRRRFGGALEPMTHGRVGYVEREGRDLVFVNYVEPLRSPLAAADAEALGYVGYFAELIGGVPIEPLARYFEFCLMRLQGVYQPDPRASYEARAFLEAARTCSPFALSAASATATTLRELEASHRAMMSVHLDKEL